MVKKPRIFGTSNGPNLLIFRIKTSEAACKKLLELKKAAFESKDNKNELVLDDIFRDEQKKPSELLKLALTENYWSYQDQLFAFCFPDHILLILPKSANKYGLILDKIKLLF